MIRRLFIAASLGLTVFQPVFLLAVAIALVLAGAERQSMSVGRFLLLYFAMSVPTLLGVVLQVAVFEPVGKRIAKSSGQRFVAPVASVAVPGLAFALDGATGSYVRAFLIPCFVAWAAYAAALFRLGSSKPTANAQRTGL
jgi:hypothetical protein